MGSLQQAAHRSGSRHIPVPVRPAQSLPLPVVDQWLIKGCLCMDHPSSLLAWISIFTRGIPREFLTHTARFEGSETYRVEPVKPLAAFFTLFCLAVGTFGKNTFLDEKQIRNQEKRRFGIRKRWGVVCLPNTMPPPNSRNTIPTTYLVWTVRSLCQHLQSQASEAFMSFPRILSRLWSFSICAWLVPWWHQFGACQLDRSFLDQTFDANIVHHDFIAT